MPRFKNPPRFCKFCQEYVSSDYTFCPYCTKKLKQRVRCLTCSQTFWTYGVKKYCDKCIRDRKEVKQIW